MIKLEYPGIVGGGEVYLKVLKAICGDTAGKSMVDLLCHRAPYTPLLGFKDRVYVDVQDRGLDHKEEQKHFINSDVFDFIMNQECPRFDVSICSDGIEHLTRADGVQLLIWMKEKSDKQILFTPLGGLSIVNDLHPDSHKSGWTPDHIDIYMKGKFACIVFPDFHPTLNAGAFFFWHCNNIQQDFERVKNELNNLI